ncbi:hypothetical protein GCM10009100_31220 [Thalassospira tepidiphila]
MDSSGQHLVVRDPAHLPENFQPRRRDENGNTYRVKYTFRLDLCPVKKDSSLLPLKTNGCVEAKALAVPGLLMLCKRIRLQVDGSDAS